MVESFYFPNKSFDYEVKVSDKEDGSLADGRISPEQVAVKIDYLPEGYDKVEIAQGHRSADAKVKGLKFIELNDCKSCHAQNKKSIGPSYMQVATKYKGSKTALETLTKKIISGGSGTWGEVPMAGHPNLSTEDAAEMSKYILSLANEADKSLPTKGSFTTKISSKDKGQGTYILRAAYEDQGANGIPALAAEQVYTLRNSKVPPHSFDKYEEINKMTFGGNAFCIPTKTGAYMALTQIDLANVDFVEFIASAPTQQLITSGGVVEVHLDSPTGQLIGATPFLVPADGFGGKPIKATIKPTTGLHDVYLIFVNPKADGRSLMVVTSIEFKQTEISAFDALEAPKLKANLEDYTGKYKMTGLPFDFIEISIKDGKVIMDAGGQGGAIDATDTPDKFDANGRATLNFVRNEAKQVTGIKMEASGFTFEGKKQP